jgi:hypothetical protein
MNFDRAKFYHFCKHLKIETKEQGMRVLGEQLLGTQTYVMDEVARGLAEDKHFFVVLKGRQLGITTISLALDLYWHFVHPGMQGTLTTDTEENREQFRSTLQMYMDGLPKEYKIPLMSHNRNQMVLKNRSRLFYQVAGIRAKGGLGRGKGITFLHGTETSSWGDEEGLASLLASLAEQNPLRYYMFESTARGFNMFHDMWVTAKRARTQKAIFVGWWRNQFYSADPKSDIYKVYWDGKLSPEEKEWTKDIKKVYNYEVNSRQIAWWRWKLHEGLKDEGLMYQEFPPTEDYAFVMTGTSFFSTARCTDAMKEAKKQAFISYRFSMGANFQDTQLLQSTERLATLKIWEEPVSTAYYVIGADPAYGSSDWADRFCIQVFRCYADGMDQVAEFATSELNTFQFAWVICYEGRELTNVLSNMQHYLWRRNDSFGISNSIGWVTTHSSKERMLNYLKDYFERGMLHMYSTECIDEMKGIVRDQGTIAAMGRAKDDRVMAAALAAAAFAEQVQPRLIQMRLTREKKVVQDAESENGGQAQVGKQVGSYLRALGFQ